MSLIFDDSPFWNLCDTLERDFFGNSFKVSPKAIKKGEGNKAIEKSKSRNNLLQTSDIVPPLDLVEKKDHFEMRVSVPGASPDEIKVDYDEDANELTVSGEVPEHKVEKEEGGKYYKELSSGSFSRKIRFGNSVKLEADKIQASLKNGILSVSVPKVPQEQNQRIKRITVHDGSKL